MPDHRRSPNVNCRICGEPTYKRLVEIRRNNGNVYCSQGCFGISCRKEKPCIVCGTLILAGLNNKTCSRSCANRHRAGIQYKINRPRDKVKNYQRLKVRLLKLRGNECKKCGYDKYEILQVHHIDRNRENNEIDNLELICPNCHAEEHFLKKSWLKNYMEGGQDGNALVLKTSERKL